MTAMIRQWILGITGAAMIAAILHAFLPKSGGVGRAGRLAAGLLLMLAAVGPLVKLDYGSLSQVLTRLRMEQADRGAELAARNDEILKALIESETEAYISDKAKKLGINCQAEVIYDWDDGGTPYPAEVRITGSLTDRQRRQLSAALEADLGVPAGKQSYTEEVE